MALVKKLKAWHLMPLSLVALILVAVFVWVGRGGFSPRDVQISIEGSSQIENGKEEVFKLVVQNNSDKALADINLSVDLPSGLAFGNRELLDEGFERIEAQSRQELEFTIMASSERETESISARMDYSPEAVSARFVSSTNYPLVIGRLDVTVILDMPNTIYSDQQIAGTIHVIPNSDIETSPIFMRFEPPQGFELQDVSVPFDFENVWRLGTLKQGQNIKREFKGKMSTKAESTNFKVSLGKLSGVSFLVLNSQERMLKISEAPLFLAQELAGTSREYIAPGERASVRITYTNKSDVALEDGTLRVLLPKNLIDFSSVVASNAKLDEGQGSIQWDETNSPALRFTDVNQSGEFAFSFRALNNIMPQNALDIEKSIKIQTSLESGSDNLALDGAILRVENILNIKLATKLQLSQNTFNESGPHPPRADELSTYTVRWALTNTTNNTKSVKVEAVLPEYAVWEASVSPQGENVRFISSTNTVVWDVGDLQAGTGYVYEDKVVEFQIGVAPEQQDINEGLVLIEQTKLTGSDTFTGGFLEQDIGETTP